jgi:MFS transporter, DHA1 family, multidrug resistance protein
MSDAKFLDRTTPPHVGTLVGMTGLSALSMAVFLPSLPKMAAEFGVPYATMQLSVGLFLAVNAALQLLVGPLSDRFGRRPILIGGMAIFALASVGCALSTSAVMFLTFRMLQSTVVVGMVLSRAIVRDLYDQQRAASVIGYVMMGMSVIPMISPAIGGWIDGAAGWRMTLWMLALSGALVLALIYADVGETLTHTGKSFRAQVREYPALLLSKRFWGYTISAMFSSGAFFAYLGGAPLIGDKIYHMSEQGLGIALGAPAVGYFVGNFVSGRFSQRIGTDVMIRIGGGAIVLGMSLAALVVWLGFDSALIFFGFVTCVGLGNGILLPNAVAGMISVDPKLAGTASGLGGALQIAGGAALSVLAGKLLVGADSSLPLIAIMLGSALLSMLATLWIGGRRV